MPASIVLTAAQIHTLSEYDEDVVVLEQPGTVGGGDIEAWICAPEQPLEQRSLVVDVDGTVIGDAVLDDIG